MEITAIVSQYIIKEALRSEIFVYVTKNNGLSKNCQRLNKCTHMETVGGNGANKTQKCLNAKLQTLCSVYLYV